MRAYELMIIFDRDLEEAAIQPQIDRVGALVKETGGSVSTTDVWGKRRLAYEIDHKDEGYYVVFEFVTEGRDMTALERHLRLADEVVRHKLIRLPDEEAARRGLLAEAG